VNLSNPTGPVLIVGSAGLDTIARASTELPRGSSAPGRIRRAYGGVGRNIAENLARLDVPTILLTAVGDDEYGRGLLEHAAQAGIDVQNSLTVPGPHMATGGYVAIYDDDGSLRVAVDQMAPIAEITPKYLRERRAHFRDASLVVLDANLSPESLAVAIRLARSSGVPVCADPAAVPLAARLAPRLDEVNVVVANGAEAAALCGWLPPEDSSEAVVLAKRLVALGVEIGVVTLADAGVGYATGETSGHIPALRVEVSDLTGAGDAFTAALLFGLRNDVPVDEAVRLGMSAAALTLRSPHTVLPELTEELLYAQLM
jgi:pseudouridine kinase